MFNWGNVYVLKNESIIENEIRTSELQKGRKNKNKLCWFLHEKSVFLTCYLQMRLLNI